MVVLKDPAVEVVDQIMDIHLGVVVRDQVDHTETQVVLLVQTVKDLLQVGVVEV